MYAKIAPLKRLPKSLSICDYFVPDNLENTIQVGQLVIIPFRKSKIFGLVLSLETSSPYAEKVKSIESVVHEIPFLRPSEVKLFETTASLYNMPLGSMIETGLPPLQKRKLKTISLSPRGDSLHKNTKLPKFVQYLTHEQHKTILQNFSQKQTLILVSEIQQTKIIAQFFENKNVALWHSELGEKEKFDLWFKIRNGEVDIIIGTRSAVFLAFFDLQHIIIDAEDEKDHKHSEGSPRFHVKDIMHLLAKIHQAEVTLTSSHPSSDIYYGIYNHEYILNEKIINSNKTIGVIEQIPKDLPTFIDLKTEHHGHKEDYFLSSPVQEKITNVQKDVFLFLNRRGSATSIFCKACGYKDICTTCQNMRVYHDADKMIHCHYCKTKSPVPLMCPKCGVELLQLQGYGTEQIEKVLKNLTKNNGAQVIRMDSDVAEKLRPELLEQPGQKIIIGTEMTFQYLNWKNIELCVCINLDQMIATPEYNGEERLWHFIQKIQYERDANSAFYIQTYNPDHAFWQSLSNPDLFYRNDLKRRKVFGYPPYSYLVKYFYGAETENEARQQAAKTKLLLEKTLTKEPKKASIYDPIALHPHFYRKKYWYGIIVLLEPNTWMEKISEVNAIIDENWKIDPRPNSILAP